MEKKTLLWDVTDECNLRCCHCYNAEKYFVKRNYELLDISQIKSALIKFHNAGYNHIHLLGGEPLIRQDIWEVIKEADKHNINITLNTNGMFLTSKNILRLLSEKNISQIIISLDGPTEESNDKIRGNGVFKIVTKNIRNLTNAIKKHNHKILTAISTVITEENAPEIYKFKTLIPSLGVDYLFFMSIYDCGNARIKKLKSSDYFIKIIPHLVNAIKIFSKYPNFNFYLDAKPKLATYLNRIIGKKIIAVEPSTCGAGDSILSMDPDGNLYPCGAFSQPNLKIKKTNIPCVNINNLKTVDELFNLENFKNFFKFKKSTYTDYCKSCEFLSICHGVCPVYIEEDKIPLECIAADYFQDQMFNEMMSMVFKLVKTNYQANNEVATFVLDSIKQRLSFKEILYKLSKKYKVDLSVLIRDIGGYISDLIIEDIITMEY